MMISLAMQQKMTSHSDKRRAAEEFFGPIELTPEEQADAILEGKKRKYFHEKHKDHWAEEKVDIKGEKKIVIKGNITGHED